MDAQNKQQSNTDRPADCQIGNIKDERDYAIRKGRVLERFNEEFFKRYRFDPLFKQVYELLIRDAHPYEIIERLIATIDNQQKTIIELSELIPPQPIVKP